LRTYRYISADSHWSVAPEVWADRVPKHLHDRLPRRVTLPNGGDGIVHEDGRMTFGGTSHFAGYGPERFDPRVERFGKEVGYGDGQQRLAEQDRDGVDAEVLFDFIPRYKGDDLVQAIVHAKNAWLAEDFCSVDRDRLLGVGALPNRGVDADIAELEHCAKLGLRAVMMTGYPSGERYPTPEDDRFWAAALDMDMPVTIHTQMALRRGERGDFMIKYPIEPEGYDRPPIDIIDRMSRYGTTHCGTLELTQMIMTGLFDRFPNLKIYWAENEIGWVPIYLEQMDLIHEANRHWIQRILGVQPLAQRPSDYVRQHAYWGFFDDPVGMRLRHDVGVDNVMWGTDFPHEVSRWPNSLEVMDEQMTAAGVTEAERRKMMCENAIGFFHLDR